MRKFIADFTAGFAECIPSARDLGAIFAFLLVLVGGVSIILFGAFLAHTYFGV
jgi:hypothetical protein